MFEEIGVRILNRIVGEYVEGVDSSQLELAVWDGTVSLQNVKIKKSCLQSLGFSSVEVYEGIIGELQIKLSWLHLRDQPVTITMKNVALRSRPCDLETMNKYADATRQSDKMKEVASWEKKNPNGKIVTPTKVSPFMISLETKILNNLQVFVDNVSLEYMDKETMLAKEPISVVAFLKKIKIQSTDENWRSIEKITSKNIFKVVKVSSLCILHKEDLHRESHAFSIDDLLTISENYKNLIKLGYRYVLKPISLTGKCTLYHLNSNNQHRVKFSFGIEELDFTLNNRFYDNYLHHKYALNRKNELIEMRTSQPENTIHENSREWIKFYATCIKRKIHLRNKNRTWKHIEKTGKRRREYIKLWLKKLEKKDIDLELEDEKEEEQLQYLHEKLPAEQIIIFRKISRDIFNQSQESKVHLIHKQVLSTKNWLWSWWKSDTANTNKNDIDSYLNEDLTFKFTSQEKAELLKILEYDSNDNFTDSENDRPKDSNPSFKFEISINTVNIKMERSDIVRPMTTLTSEKLHIKYIMDTNYSEFQLLATTFDIENGSMNNSYTKLLSVENIRDPDSKYSSLTPNVDFRIKTRGKDENRRTKIECDLLGLTINYHMDYFIQVPKFFMAPLSPFISMDKLVQERFYRFSGWTPKGKRRIWRQFLKKQQTTFKVQVGFATFVFPNHPHDEYTGVAVLDGHDLIVFDTPIPERTIEELQSFSIEKFCTVDNNILMRLMLEKLILYMTDAELLVGPGIKAIKHTMVTSHLANKYAVVPKRFLKMVLDITRSVRSLHVPFCILHSDFDDAYLAFSDIQFQIVAFIFTRCFPVSFDYHTGDEFNEFIDPTYDPQTRIDAKIEWVYFAHQDSTPEKLSRKFLELDFNFKNFNLPLHKVTNPELWKLQKLFDIKGGYFNLKVNTGPTHISVHVSIPEVAIHEFTALDDISQNLITTKLDSQSDLCFNLRYERCQRIAFFQDNYLEIFDHEIYLDLNGLEITLSPMSICCLSSYAIVSFTKPYQQWAPNDILVHNDESSEASPSKTRLLYRSLNTSILLKDMDSNIIVSLEAPLFQYELLAWPEHKKNIITFPELRLVENKYAPIDLPSKFPYIMEIKSIAPYKMINESFDMERPETKFGSFLFLRFLSVSVVYKPLVFYKLFNFLQTFKMLNQNFSYAANKTFKKHPVTVIRNGKYDIWVDSIDVHIPKAVDIQNGICDYTTLSCKNIFTTMNWDKKSELYSRYWGIISIQAYSEVYLRNENHEPISILDPFSLFSKKQFKFSKEGNNSTESFYSISPVNVHISEFQISTLTGILNSVKSITGSSTPFTILSNSLLDVFGYEHYTLYEIQNYLSTAKINEVRSTFLENINIPVIKIFVYHGDLSGTKIRRNLLLSTVLSAISVENLRDANGKDALNVICQRISVKNHKDNSIKHIKVLKCRQSKHPHINISILKNENKTDTLSYSISLRNMELSLDLALIKMVISFFKQCSRKHSSSVLDGKDSILPLANSTSDSEKKNEVTYKFKLIRSQISFLFGKQSNPYGVLYFKLTNLELLFGTTFDMLLKNFSSYFIENNKKEEKMYIIKTFSGYCKDYGSDSGVLKHKFNINFEKLTMKISLNQIRMMREFNKNIHQMINEIKLFGSKVTNKKRGTIFSLMSKSIKDSFSHSDFSSSSSSTVSENETEQLTSITRNEYLIAWQGINITLLGDIDMLPIMSIGVNPFNLTYKQLNLGFEIQTSWEIFSKVFNYSQSCWEPILDEFPLTLHLRKLENTHPALLFEVLSGKITEFTMSAKTLSILSNIPRLLQEPPIKDIEEPILPYSIVNDTEFDLTIWEFHPEIKKKINFKKLQPGSEISWGFEGCGNHKTAVESDNIICVSISALGKECIYNVVTNTEGERLFVLDDDNTKEKNRVVCELKELKENIKQITFRSTIEIKNLTNVDLEFEISDPSGGSLKSACIEPNAVLNVPITKISESRIRMRPKTDIPYSWCKEDIHWKDLLKGALSLSSLASDGVTYQNFEVTDICNSEESFAKSYPHMKIIVTVPIILQNLLPLDMSFTITQGKEVIKPLTVLKEHEKMVISEANLYKDSHIHIKHLGKSEISYTSACVINSKSVTSEEEDHVIPLASKEKNEIFLGLHSERLFKTRSKLIRIYSPYLIVNETGQELFLKNIVGDMKESDCEMNLIKGNSRSQLFSLLEAGNDKNGKQITKLHKTKWSEDLCFNMLDQSFEVVLWDKNKDTCSKLGLTVTQGFGYDILSKIIKVKPRFTIINNLDSNLEIGDIKCNSLMNIPKGKSVPLLRVPEHIEDFLRIRAFAETSIWSDPISIAGIGETFLKISKNERDSVLLKIVVVSEQASLIIRISNSNNYWPFAIRNYTKHEFTVYQKKPEHYCGKYSNLTNRFPEIQKYVVPGHSVIPFAWDIPSVEHKRLVVNCEGHEKEVHLLELGSSNSMKVPGKFLTETSEAVSMTVSREGAITVLDIKDAASKKLRRLKTGASSMFNNKKKELKSDNNLEELPLLRRISIKIDGLGISLINISLQEFCYIQAKGIELLYDSTDMYNTFTWKLRAIQIDNQMFNAKYENILYPVITRKHYQNNPYVFSGSIRKMKLKDERSIECYKFVMMTINEFALKVDEGFLVEILNFSKAFDNIIDDEEETTELLEDNSQIIEAENIKEIRDSIFKNVKIFELIIINAVKFHFSFTGYDKMYSTREQRKLRTYKQNRALMLINFYTVALGDINEAKIKMKRLKLKNLQVPYSALVRSIEMHYRQQFFYQFHKILGSSSYIGNPVGLFNSFNTEFRDWVDGSSQRSSTPDLGDHSKHGSGVVGKGINGVRHVGKSISGFKNGSIRLALPKSFHHHHNKSAARKSSSLGVSPSNNSTSSLEAPLSDVSSVVSELVPPSHDVSSFVERREKSLIDITHSVSHELHHIGSDFKNSSFGSSSVFDDSGVHRVRLPRLIGPDGVIKDYDPTDAQGQSWLKTVGHGKFIKDTYLGHVQTGGDQVVLVSDIHILGIQLPKETILWKVSYKNVTKIAPSKEFLTINLKQDDPMKLQFDDVNKCKIVYKKAQNALTNFNLHQNGEV
ncbi:hypothetical protein TBLA_0E01410 [Henningerozyma blattae CBS 6284]|uniref:Vacuolar protein sorting-associated protein n=1 Tax=Henningerozyma blattae (strain ATCC 34711 / CBS 6284 / DSM 70876 / NBRC 10599 / NRRL Y-10934 / UCD 77-7) TaxID=1071380 RepID=I2H498_HENB6|nr:hypothetical protein TBLA_0E01410 [Tetrapisispora blattae CBS 6284]CCH61200.1 hypothetical protein TBLA_0E01410 [Tetrapisispora blattae CBS 6284]